MAMAMGPQQKTSLRVKMWFASHGCRGAILYIHIHMQRSELKQDALVPRPVATQQTNPDGGKWVMVVQCSIYEARKIGGR